MFYNIAFLVTLGSTNGSASTKFFDRHVLFISHDHNEFISLKQSNFF